MKYLSQKLKHLENKLNQFKSFHKIVTKIDFQSQKSKVLLLTRLKLTLKTSIRNTSKTIKVTIQSMAQLQFLYIPNTNFQSHFHPHKQKMLLSYFKKSLSMKVSDYCSRFETGSAFIGSRFFFSFYFIFPDLSFSYLKFEATKITLCIRY